MQSEVCDRVHGGKLWITLFTHLLTNQYYKSMEKEDNIRQALIEHVDSMNTKQVAYLCAHLNGIRRHELSNIINYPWNTMNDQSDNQDYHDALRDSITEQEWEDKELLDLQN
jgi:hypothetical protein